MPRGVKAIPLPMLRTATVRISVTQRERGGLDVCVTNVISNRHYLLTLIYNIDEENISFKTT